LKEAIMKYPVVAIDESGNTGSDLLSPEQPVFALASTAISLAEAEGLLGRIRTPQTQEIKFSKLKKTPSGRLRILEFLRASELTNSAIKITLFHKRFMIVTKVVDLLVETMAHGDGIDLYRDGANIALSNLHFFCMPTFCGKKRTEAFFRSFLSMIREQTDAAVRRFYRAAWALYDNSIDAQYATNLSSILYSQKSIQHILANIDKYDLDPAVPALFDHCVFWGQQFGRPFDLLHDESKTILREKGPFERVMSRGEQEHLIGYDRRKFVFPLRARQLQFARSADDARLQVVDMIAGAGTYWLDGLIIPPAHKEFWEEISTGVLKNLVLGALWPVPNVTPKDLETQYTGGTNAVDHMADFLRNYRERT
jgi:hypothetical protein